MTPEKFQELQQGIPNGPGIYRYYDREGGLLYVGKAKNLRKRVASYFNRSGISRKTTELVRRIERIECTVVETEQDALLLENALIKEFQPRFNIDLKDDKTYPYIVIRNEPFPRVFLTRRLIRDGSEYLGPFTSAGRVRELLGFIRQHVQMRTCRLNLSEAQIRKGRYRLCLEYHLGNCKGPCVGLQTEADYAEGLQRLRGMLKGNLAPVMQHYRREMEEHARNLDFEKAETVRKRIEHLKSFRAKSAIVNPRLGDLDVFSIADADRKAYVNYIMFRDGAIVDSHTITANRRLEEDVREILSLAICRLRETFHSEAEELVVPFPVDTTDPKIRCTIPKGGDKRKLLELSERNAVYYREEQVKKERLLLSDEQRDMSETLGNLQEDLSLQDLPSHIECFDNSHFQGSYPVSAMVCFRDGQPSKKDYRHFNIRTVEGIDDFATMREVVHRRYARLLEEGSGLPQLVVIDGGKGQLGAALSAISDLGLTGRMTVIGLAKNEEELFFPGDRESLKLPYASPSLKLIRRIRDEVHRFGIGFHRRQRSRGTFRNELEAIPGIGKQTADELIKAFRSVRKVSEASEESLAQVVGAARAKRVAAYFRKGPGADDGEG